MKYREKGEEEKEKGERRRRGGGVKVSGDTIKATLYDNTYIYIYI